ncbi:MAG: carboxyl-terminal processing protease [Candidatus Peregrinibacteria bacterium Gr01-1014_25]|nr:MAG: carboxyl-terminal processing protease [Candidatus Peregrinibacteria bacterium Gr01-1014_25]
MRIVRATIGWSLTLATALAFALPGPSAFAATYWFDRLPQSDAPISRGDFIRAAIDALEIPTDARTSLPYRRPVPSAIKPFVAAAYTRGALKHFGDELFPGRPITTGDALQMLVAIQGLDAKGKSRTFPDVPPGSALDNAVQAALEKGWIEPGRPNRFGVDRVMSGKATRILLRKVLGEDDDTGEKIVIRFTNNVSRKPLPRQELLQSIWYLINEQYLYKEKITDDAVLKAAEALVQSLEDPYTAYVRPAKTEVYQSRIQGRVTGIGAQVEYTDNALVIVAPFPNSPAKKAGLQAGDQILFADGVSLAGMTVEGAVSKVRGPEGSTVVLTVRRGSQTFDVSVVRAVVAVPEIDTSWMQGIAVVHLFQFGERTERELRPTLQEIARQEPRGIVLDLRNNPGGLLDAAEVVLSNFLPQGSVVARIVGRDGEYAEETDDPPVIPEKTPVVVLVNKGSASASEIVAGALQDAGRAVLVGEKTFGKGTVQQIIDFHDGSSLRMTVAEWLTPSGRKINKEGIEPDFTVRGDEERDAQLVKALDLISARTIR